jgi:hypothetical protein
MLAYHGGEIGCDFEIQFGLIGAPDRRFVIERMERHIDAPHGHVSDGFLWNLALLAEPPDPPLPLPELGSFPERGMPNAQQADAHRKRMESRFRDYVARLAGSVTRKTGTARAACLRTLLELSRQPAGGGVPPARAGELREQLATVFSEFPADEQHTLLTQRWGLLKGPAMLPVVRAIVERRAPLSWLGGEDLRTVALRRLHELAPAEAERILLEEARRPVPRVGVEALGLLPPATAGLDGVIVDHLERVGPSMDGMHQLGFLLARYGTRAVLPRAEAYYQDRLNKWMCWEAPFAAYFLRVDPPRGARALEGVLAERRGKPHPDCFKSILGETARLHYAQELETIAVAHLDDPDPDVAVDAARVLGKRGSAAAEPPLWRRLGRWHAQWKDRAMELTEGNDHGPLRLEEALREGLALSPAWNAGRRELDKLARLAVTPNARSWVESNLRSREQDGKLVLSFWAGLDGSQDFTVAQYRLPSLEAAKAKLAQFSRGAAFVWRHDASVTDPAEEMRAIGELEPFMRARGLSLAGAPQGRAYGKQ